MRKKRLVTHYFLCITLLFCATTFKTITAQNRNLPSKIDRYEIAIDLQQLFSDGYPNKVLFKINNIRDNKIEGAYRFGVGASYWISKYKITHDNENYDLTAKEHQTNLSFSLGYEFQKNFDKAIFYYGVDVGASLGVTDNMDFPYIDEAYNMFLVPFAGVKVLLNDNLSVAFESGLKNYYQWWKGEGSNVAPDNRQYHSFYQSKLELPYSLTFNFNF